MPPQPEHLNCPHCGYDLRGQTVERCPECSFHYDAQGVHSLRAAALDRCLTPWLDAVRVLSAAGCILLVGLLAHTTCAGAHRFIALPVTIASLISIAAVHAIHEHVIGGSGVRLRDAPEWLAGLGRIAWVAMCIGLLPAAFSVNAAAVIGGSMLFIGVAWAVLGQLRYADLAAKNQIESSPPRERAVIRRCGRTLAFLLIADMLLLATAAAHG